MLTRLLLPTTALLATALVLDSSSAQHGPQCFGVLEKGFDYVGNDIDHRPNTSVDICCYLCGQRTDCKAFSWTAEDNGTCYFKSGQGKIVVNAAVTSAVMTGWGPQCRVTDDNIDYVGNDIGSAPSADPFGCCDKCTGTLGCRAFTHTDYNGGTCWLKSHKMWTAIKPGARSMLVYAQATTKCTLWPDTDFEGNDVGSVAASKADECCDKCKNWTGCTAYTWTKYNGGTCWLKNRQGPAKTKQGAISAVVVPNPTGLSCALESGMDYVGNDIGSAASSDAYGCCSICTARAGCKAFSWTDFNGGTCWLKWGKTNTVANPNVKSAVV